MKLRDKQPLVAAQVRKMAAMPGFWRAVAGHMDRPRQARHEVNLLRLEAFAQPKETVVVPGIVLGTGALSKPLTVAAVKFSHRARQEIVQAGGACLTIEELLQKHPDGKGIRIMG